MTNKIDDGGPAFALLIPGGERPVMGGRIEFIAEKHYPGMSLRDWFAGQALAGMMTDANLTINWEATAVLAYNFADAMIAERKREGK